ncbi:LytR/AlgR family response regulator transcription factor [Labilibacter marinus]|uniref:LytR/AlgR family response regulator transcription factor n=1 Tax=Labilibacter marinus TaxID=1477105 RepID=UPI00094F9341|nr:LytTR family DNA-binding domain-containing protein [Labilibacter marinus]
MSYSCLVIEMNRQMDTVKVLIADDDSKVCNALETILKQNFVSIEVVAKTDSVDQTIDSLNELKPQIAILDIHLLGGTAIEVIKQTSHLDYKVVFMSAYQEYALEDIRFAQIPFIYKPFDINELIVTIDQAIADLMDVGYETKIQTFFKNSEIDNKDKQIVLNTDSGITSVLIHDIVCGESMFGRSRFYFIAQKSVETARPLRRYESMLQSYLFYRCHTQFVINLNHVVKFEYEAKVVLMSNGMAIPVDARRFDGLKRRLSQVVAEDLSATPCYKMV